MLLFLWLPVLCLIEIKAIDINGEAKKNVLFCPMWEIFPEVAEVRFNDIDDLLTRELDDEDTETTILKAMKDANTKLTPRKDQERGKESREVVVEDKEANMRMRMHDGIPVTCIQEIISRLGKQLTICPAFML